MWSRIAGTVSFVAGLITIGSFVAQVARADFGGNIFTGGPFRLPVLRISYLEAGIATIVLVTLGIFFLLKNTSIYGRSMLGIVGRYDDYRGEGKIDPLFVVAVLARYPIAYFWCKAFVPGGLIPPWSLAFIVAGLMFLVEFLMFLAYLAILDS